MPLKEVTHYHRDTELGYPNQIISRTIIFHSNKLAHRRLEAESLLHWVNPNVDWDFTASPWRRPWRPSPTPRLTPGWGNLDPTPRRFIKYLLFWSNFLLSLWPTITKNDLLLRTYRQPTLDSKTGASPNKDLFLFPAVQALRKRLPMRCCRVWDQQRVLRLTPVMRRTKTQTYFYNSLPSTLWMEVRIRLCGFHRQHGS